MSFWFAPTTATCGQRETQFGEVLAGFGNQQLGHIAFRSRPRTGDGATGPAQIQQSQCVEFGDHLACPAYVVRRYFGGDAVEQLDQVVGTEPCLATGTAADRDPLIAERGPGHQPTLVHVADHVLIRNEDVIEEDLVEVGVAGHAAQRVDRRQVLPCRSPPWSRPRAWVRRGRCAPWPAPTGNAERGWSTPSAR